MFTIALLDADGTLFDFNRSERHALALTLAQYGLEPSDALCAHYHSVNEDLWRQFERGEITKEALLSERFGRFFASIGRRVDSVQCNLDYLDHLAGEADLLPGAEELCRTLAPHMCLCIATNGVSRVQRRRLENSRLRPYISHLFISDDIGCPKPDVRYFDRVFELLGESDRSKAVMLGDSLTSDMLGASRAGIASCWFCPNDQGAGNVPVNWRIRTLREFIPIALTGSQTEPSRAES